MWDLKGALQNLLERNIKKGKKATKDKGHY